MKTTGHSRPLLAWIVSNGTARSSAVAASASSRCRSASQVARSGASELAAGEQTGELASDELGFLEIVTGHVHTRWWAVRVAGPGGGPLSERCRERIGQRDDGASRAVIFFQDDNLRAWERARELGEQPRVRASEPIHALKGVAYDGDVLVSGREALEDGGLQLTAVLVLVDEHPTIGVLEHAQGLLIHVQQAKGKGQHGRVIHGRTIFETALICGAELGEHVAVEHIRIDGRHPFGPGVRQPMPLHGAVELREGQRPRVQLLTSRVVGANHQAKLAGCLAQHATRVLAAIDGGRQLAKTQLLAP